MENTSAKLVPIVSCPIITKKIPVIETKNNNFIKKKLNETDYNKTRSTLESWCVMPHARQNLVTCGGGVMTK